MRHLAASLLLLSSTTYAASKSSFEYADILVGEAVGEFSGRMYDAKLKLGEDDERFIGNQILGGGWMLGGGAGLRGIFRFDPGVRLSVEGSIQWGRMNDLDSPFRDHSTVMRGELLSGLGYEGTFAKVLTLHTATIIGVSFQELQVTGSPIAEALMAPGSGPPTPVKLVAADLRLGQQVGLHVHLSSIVALYADATFDYDGQWRVRAGFALGKPAGIDKPERSGRSFW
jgi:hypothetical protein